MSRLTPSQFGSSTARTNVSEAWHGCRGLVVCVGKFVKLDGTNIEVYIPVFLE